MNYENNTEKGLAVYLHRIFYKKTNKNDSLCDLEAQLMKLFYFNSELDNYKHMSKNNKICIDLQNIFLCIYLLLIEPAQ